MVTIEDHIKTHPSSGKIVTTLKTNTFPGLGGTFEVNPPLYCVKREFPQGPIGSGHRHFLLGVVLKKLDDYFVRTKAYDIHHIPRPFGSESGDSEFSLEQFVDGSEHFAWHMGTVRRPEPVDLAEWKEFRRSFAMAGIKMGEDVHAPEGVSSQNIRHRNDFHLMSLFKDSLWMRIDYDPGSLPLEYDRLSDFLSTNHAHLRAHIGPHRLEMIELATDYLAGRPLNEVQNERLRLHCYYYREKAFTVITPSAWSPTGPPVRALDTKGVLLAQGRYRRGVIEPYVR